MKKIIFTILMSISVVAFADNTEEAIAKLKTCYATSAHDCSKLVIASDSSQMITIENLNLENINLSGAKLSNIIFSNVNFNGAKLLNSDLSDIKFVDSKLNKADFTQAEVKVVEFNKCEATEAVFNGARLPLMMKSINSNFINASFKSAYLFYPAFWDSKLEGADFSKATIYGLKLFGENKFAKVKMVETTLDVHSTFTNVVLDDANFSNSQLKDVKFKDIYLKRVDFNGSQGFDQSSKFSNVNHCEMVFPNGDIDTTKCE